MLQFGIKYLASLAFVIGFFANAVACGTQLYRISVEEDIDGRHNKHAASKDPATPSYGIHTASGWTTIPIKFHFGQTLTSSQRQALVAAMKQWEWAVGKTLFEASGTHEGIDGDSFKDLYSSLKDNVNGDYLDNNWTKTGKPDHVLATTIWDTSANGDAITKADIRFNAQNYMIGDSLALTSVDNKEVVDMQSLALHEVGHLLGLAHIPADVDQYSIMNPSLFIGEGLTTREMSKDDILRIQKVYGCEGKACNVDTLVAEQRQTQLAVAQNSTKPQKRPKKAAAQPAAMPAESKPTTAH